MDVNEAVRRTGEKSWGNQEAVSRDNDDIRREGGELGLGFGLAEGGRLEDLESLLDGELLYRGLGLG